MNYEYFNRSFILFSGENDWICYLLSFAKRLRFFDTENNNNHSLVFHLKFIKSIINEHHLNIVMLKRSFNHFDNEESEKKKPKLFHSKYYFGTHLSTNSFKRFTLSMKMQLKLRSCWTTTNGKLVSYKFSLIKCLNRATIIHFIQDPKKYHLNT